MRKKSILVTYTNDLRQIFAEYNFLLVHCYVNYQQIKLHDGTTTGIGKNWSNASIMLILQPSLRKVLCHVMIS